MTTSQFLISIIHKTKKSLSLLKKKNLLRANLQMKMQSMDLNHNKI